MMEVEAVTLDRVGVAGNGRKYPASEVGVEGEW